MRWWQSESASRAVGYMVDEGVGEGQTAGQDMTVMVTSRENRGGWHPTHTVPCIPEALLPSPGDLGYSVLLPPGALPPLEADLSLSWHKASGWSWEP